MKRLVCMLIAVVMTVAFSAAFAATEINWADLQEQGAQLIANGEVIAVGDTAFSMWVPNIMTAAELTEEDLDGGYVGYYTTSDNAYAIAAIYTDMGIDNVADYAAFVTEYGATEVEEVVINGHEAISYVLADTDTAVTAFVMGDGTVFEVSGAPKSDEGFASILMFAMASVQF